MIRRIAQPLPDMRSCNDRYGDCFTMPGPENVCCVVFSDPKALEIILTAINCDRIRRCPASAKPSSQPLLGAQSVIGLER